MYELDVNLGKGGKTGTNNNNSKYTKLTIRMVTIRKVPDGRT